jgi:hypothetical protein
VVYNNISSPSSFFDMKGGASKFNTINVTAGSLKLQDSNIIDSVIVNGALDIFDNNTINSLVSTKN